MRHVNEPVNNICVPLADALYKSYPLDIFPTKLLQSKIGSFSFSDHLLAIIDNGPIR